MILECSIENFRSIYKKQTFSMLASSAKSKIDNTFDVDLLNGDSIKLIKTATILGANASGKSNFIHALFIFQRFIVNLHENTVDKPIFAHDPFLFNSNSSKEPSIFEIIFLTKDKKKFQYKIVFDKNEIIEEELYHFPKKKKQNVFKRNNDKNLKDKNIHIGKLGKNFGYKKYEIFKKLPLLSIFGETKNYQTIISQVYIFFGELEIWNVTSSSWLEELGKEIEKEIQKTENEKLLNQIQHLFYEADTQIQSLLINKDKKRQADIVFSKHKIFENNNEIGMYNLPFSQESFGTRQLFALGGLMLKILNNGGVIIFDELDNSMHSLLTRLLIQLFHESQSKNAQLIFTAHDTNLLKEFRTDQIWFTEKNELGETELFSAQDFEGVREDIPFAKWYLAGQFGAIPHITEIQSILKDGETKI